jgi:hypothetical protein
MTESDFSSPPLIKPFVLTFHFSSAAAPLAHRDCTMGLNRTESEGTAPEYQAYRACDENHTALIQPPLSDSELLLKSNLSLQHSSSVDAEFWDSLRHRARRQLLADACHYTSAYRDLPTFLNAPLNAVAEAVPTAGETTTAQVPIVMAGHQPTLFHPGVWFKNFALQRIASDAGAHAINLVIDNDVAAGRSIRVPVRDSIGRVFFQSISYDAGGVGIPYEQAKIRDLRQFDRFDREVRDAIAPLVSNPCVVELWPHAREAIRRCEIAGCALAQARHRLEADIGWQTLEVPLGVAVRGLPFARFVVEMIDEAERFQQVYNAAADHYRAWHGIRSTAHPVPNLHRDGEWIELPLWVYGNDAPSRRAVWVRRISGHGRGHGLLELSDRGVANTAEHRLTLPSGDREKMAEVLAEAASPEFKLRPRALVTTMFARLVLSDLFLHGIGGGKYDQLADRIICEFFHRIPPALQVVSATVRLPGQDLDRQRADAIESLQRRIRETQYHGESWVDLARGENQSLRERKRSLLENIPPEGSRADWHRQIERINLQFAAQLQSARQSWQAELQRLRLEAAEEQILASREFSFCLFPLAEIMAAFEQMLA